MSRWAFYFFLLFWPMAGLTLCRCLEALVLHRIIKMPNSCKRDPNLSLERKKKNLFFVFNLWCRGTKRWKFYSVRCNSESRNEHITFCREWGMVTLYLYTKSQQEAHGKDKCCFFKKLFFFLNVWVYIWDGSLAGLTQDRERAVCASVAHGRGGSLLHVGLPWWSLIGFPIRTASSS